MELELAIKAASGLDADHGILGGTLPSDRSPLRGNRFPEPSDYRQDRELAEAATPSRARSGCGRPPIGWASTATPSKLPSASGAGRRWRGGWAGSPAGSWPPAPKPRAFQLTEQLGSVNAAAAELGTTWPSLRKAFGRHGLGMPARNPEAVRQRAIAAAHKRTGQPATPGPGPGVRGPQPGALPARERPEAELYQWVRRDEEYAPRRHMPYRRPAHASPSP